MFKCAIVHENNVTINKKTGLIFFVKYDLDISVISPMKSLDLIKMTHDTRTDLIIHIQRKALRSICYSTSVLNRLHTEISFSCMIVTDVTDWFGAIPMQLCLCYSYWWSTNIWRGLVTFRHHQPTVQHTQPFTPRVKKKKKNMTISAFQTTEYTQSK